MYHIAQRGKDKEDMKQIVCFGDSNTYGYCPLEGRMRYRSSERWTGLLKTYLGAEYQIEEEGFNGRTTNLFDPYKIGKNGLEVLPSVLAKYPYADLLILMLGTNDLKAFYHRTAEEIADAAGELVLYARSCMKQDAKLLFIAPAPVGEQIETSPFAGEYGGCCARERSLQFSEVFARKASELGVEFFDAAEAAIISEEDMIHFSPEGHQSMARALKQKILEIL